MAIFPSGRILVAASGGPDSTALLVALHEAGRDIVAAHYDHAVREGSDAVAHEVRALCARLGVRVITEHRLEPLPKGSLQAAARTLRYAFLERARIAARADVVALAHTADDVVEGVVLHLMRGCGMSGFRGMPARRGTYVRPWLGVWRSEVREFLKQRHISSYEDPSNLDLRFARVRARLHILPALERDRPGIMRRFHAAAMAAAGRQEEAAARSAKVLASGPVTKNALQAMSPAQAAETLRHLYVRAGGSEPGLSRVHLAAMRDLSRPGRGGRGVDLPGGLRFRIVGDKMEVVRSQRATAAPPRLEVTR
jgi:tRNA(Ile)-lysidine synthase